MRVAAVQFKPAFKEFESNLAQMEDWVLKAAKAGAELIVLPELATTGYSFTSKVEANEFAEVFHDEEENDTGSFLAMRGLAKSLKVAIAWGFVERGRDGTLYNCQALAIEGKRMTTYRKRNLWGSDFLWAAPGDHSPTIVDWRGKKIGMLVCRDIRDKSDVSDDLYEVGDADIVALSSNFGAGAVPSVSWVNFATGNEVSLIVSNRFGQEYGNEAFHDFGHGGIMVIRPTGECVREGFRLSDACMVLADV